MKLLVSTNNISSSNKKSYQCKTRIYIKKTIFEFSCLNEHWIDRKLNLLCPSSTKWFHVFTYIAFHTPFTILPVTSIKNMCLKNTRDTQSTIKCKSCVLICVCESTCLFFNPLNLYLLFWCRLVLCFVYFTWLDIDLLASILITIVFHLVSNGKRVRWWCWMLMMMVRKISIHWNRSYRQILCK